MEAAPLQGMIKTNRKLIARVAERFKSVDNFTSYFGPDTTT